MVQAKLSNFLPEEKTPVSTFSIKKLRFIDLFAGLGGIRLGFEQACKELGIKTECMMTSEIKEHALEALEHNFKHKMIVGDITKVDEKTIPDFDVLLAGFPCQAFSSAGKGLGFLDTRGTLFFDVARIIKEKKPKAFVLENVEGLVNHDKINPKDKIGRTLTIILQTLVELGYKVNWKLINSENYGVPQKRFRVYIVGTLEKTISLDFDHLPIKTFGSICEHGLPVKDSHFTRCLFEHYSPDQLYGKAIKDKRGGEDNIHSWDIGLKGEVSKEESELLEMIFRERRRKKWAKEVGIKWMDGMPLTLAQISTFAKYDNLEEMLNHLVSQGYMVREYPKQLVRIDLEDGKYKTERHQDKTKELGYNIVAGKLSFEFTKILDINDSAPTLVATDVSKLGVVDGNGLRTLSLREGLRLFGYPEKYSLEMFNTKERIDDGFDLLGNTVTVPVIKMISKRVVEEVWGEH